MIAREHLGALVDIGHVRSTPRHWMRGRITMTPGLRFLYNAQRPGVCALLIGDAVVTVVTRSMFAGRRIERLFNRDTTIEVAQPWLPTKPARTEDEAA